jgi:hypothetical protein
MNVKEAYEKGVEVYFKVDCYLRNVGGRGWVKS